MTVIMALKRLGEVWLGTDTRITEGDYKVDYSPMMDSKVLTLQNALVGAAGELTMRNYMELFVGKDENYIHPFENKLDVIEFFLKFKRFLKRQAGLGSSDINQVQGMHNTQWLVATRSQIFTMDQDGAILEFPVFCVIGSGTHTARAILEYLTTYQPKLSPGTILSRAHEITIHHNITCGGNQIQVNVSKELK